MSILIFDDSVSGHHLEYLHHLYSLAVDAPEHYFFFLLPKDFEDVKGKFEWNPSNHIQILYLSDKEKRLCSKSNLLMAAWYKSRIIHNAVKQYSIDKVWLIMLMHLMPFLPFLLPKRTKIVGILYRIYLYDAASKSCTRLWMEKLRYKLMVRHECVEKILVLNDEWATRQLNLLYKTDKFRYLPDPIPEIDDNKVENLREKLGLSALDKIFLHFGGLDIRKGTMEIAKAINCLSEEELQNKAFIFAGKVSPSLKEAGFYQEVEVACKKAKVFLFDEFCSYEFLNNLCFSCDYILIPYKNSNQSSGVIGYAAYFEKPVIGPSEGLLGRLIKSNSLGVTLRDVSAKGLHKVLCTTLPPCESIYALSHSVKDFNRIIWG